MEFVCSKCGEDTSAVSHTCDICGRHNHVICGVVMGEGFGGTVRCFGCASVSSVPSASPLVAAFSRQVAQAVADGVSEDALSLANMKKPRASQHVTKISDRIKVIEWIEERGEYHGVFSAAAEVHKGIAGRDKHKATVNILRWWKDRERLLALKHTNVTQVIPGMKKRFHVKADQGRGPKTHDWVVWIYEELELEFRRMQKLGVKLSYDLVRQMAQFILETSTGSYTAQTLLDGKTLESRLNTSWVQRFCTKKNIVMRAQSGKLKTSPEKEAEIEQSIALHLGQLKRLFTQEGLDEAFVSNMDETHVLIDMHNKKCLGFRGQESVSYLDVVGGGEGMTLIVKLRGGSDARLEPAMVIFQNKNCSYPIHGLPDDVAGVTYRSGPKGWMDKRVFKQWIESDTCNKVENGPQEWIFMDNAGGHKAAEDLEASMQELNKKVKFLPPNSTHLTQPADSFIIQMIKQEWRTCWETKKLELVNAAAFKNKTKDGAPWSGKLKNPGKKFYLELAAHCVKKVSEARDGDGINLVRKAMIRCGLGKNINGLWEEKQLKPELQAIINQYPAFFAMGYNTAPV